MILTVGERTRRMTLAFIKQDYEEIFTLMFDEDIPGPDYAQALMDLYAKSLAKVDADFGRDLGTSWELFQSKLRDKMGRPAEDKPRIILPD